MINKPSTATGVLSQKDADEFAAACREYTEKVTEGAGFEWNYQVIVLHSFK